MADEPQTAAEIAAARQEFLNNPPPILDPDEPVAPPEPTAADDEGALLDDLTKPPAAPEGAPAGAPAPAPAPSGTPDPYAAFGGEEAVRRAHEVQEAMRSEQGVRALVANGLVALGYSPDQIRAALAAEAPVAPAPAAAPAAPDPFADLDDEDVVTVAQTRQLIEHAVKQATEAAVAASGEQQQPLAEVIRAQQQATVRSTTDAALIGVLGPLPENEAEAAAYRANVDAILERGAKYYDPNQWANPAHIQETVVKANAELNAEQEARFQAYLVKKKAARDAQPVNTGGGAGGEGPLPEPKSLGEARKQLREARFFE